MKPPWHPPASGAAQTPSLQTCPGAHEMAQPPQCCGSCARSAPQLGTLDESPHPRLTPASNHRTISLPMAGSY
jgi:hypothetical protein